MSLEGNMRFTSLIYGILGLMFSGAIHGLAADNTTLPREEVYRALHETMKSRSTSADARRSAAIKIIKEFPESDAAFYTVIDNLGAPGLLWRDFYRTDLGAILKADRWVASVGPTTEQYSLRCILASSHLAEIIRNGTLNKADPHETFKNKIERELTRLRNTVPYKYHSLAVYASIHLRLSELYYKADSGQIKAESDYWSKLDEYVNMDSSSFDGWDDIYKRNWLAIQAVLMSPNALSNSAEKWQFFIYTRSIDLALQYLKPFPEQLACAEHPHFTCPDVPPIEITARYKIMALADLLGPKEVVFKTGEFITRYSDWATTGVLSYTYEVLARAYLDTKQLAQAKQCYINQAVIDPKSYSDKRIRWLEEKEQELEEKERKEAEAKLPWNRLWNKLKGGTVKESGPARKPPSRMIGPPIGQTPSAANTAIPAHTPLPQNP